MSNLHLKLWTDTVRIPISYGGDLIAIEQWCHTNLGEKAVDWTWASNANHYVFFIPHNQAAWFMLRWGGQ
jgi:hypothetical protein